MRLLHIQSSPNLTSSVTRALSAEFVETWCASHPETEVELLDLVKTPLPHWGPDAISGFLTTEDKRTPRAHISAEYDAAAQSFGRHILELPAGGRWGG